MWADAVMDVAVKWPVKLDFIGTGEDICITSGADERYKDFIAWLDSDRFAFVVDCGVDLRFSIGAKCAVETDTFHNVVGEFLVGFRGIFFGQFVDVWQMLLAGV